MSASTYTGHKTANDKLFCYTRQDEEGWFFFINKANGNKLFESTQRFESSYQATDSGAHFIQGYQLGKRSKP